jgi:hypothetical protein
MIGHAVFSARPECATCCPGSYRPCAEHGALLCPFHRADVVRRQLLRSRMGEDWKEWPASDRAPPRLQRRRNRAQRLVGAQSPTWLQNSASGRRCLALVPKTYADNAGLSSERSDRPFHFFRYFSDGRLAFGMRLEIADVLFSPRFDDPSRYSHSPFGAPPCRSLSITEANAARYLSYPLRLILQ